MTSSTTFQNLEDVLDHTSRIHEVSLDIHTWETEEFVDLLGQMTYKWTDLDVVIDYWFPDNEIEEKLSGPIGPNPRKVEFILNDVFDHIPRELVS